MAMEEHERLISRCDEKMKTTTADLEKLGEEEHEIVAKVIALGQMVVVHGLNDAETKVLLGPLEKRMGDIKVKMKQLQEEQDGLNAKKRMAENLLDTARGAKEDRDLHMSMARIVEAAQQFVGSTPGEVEEEVRKVEDGYEALKDMRASYLPTGSDTGAAEDFEARSDLMAALKLGQDKVVGAATLGVSPLTTSEITASHAINRDKLAMVKAALKGTSSSAAVGGVATGAGGGGGGTDTGFPPFPIAPSHLPVSAEVGPGSMPVRGQVSASSALPVAHEEEPDAGDFGFLSGM